MTEDEVKRLTDRAKHVLDWIEGERQRCTNLIMAIDDRGFLLYCINECFCQADELVHWRKRYHELGRDTDPEVEDLM